MFKDLPEYEDLQPVYRVLHQHPIFKDIFPLAAPSRQVTMTFTVQTIWDNILARYPDEPVNEVNGPNQDPEQSSITTSETLAPPRAQRQLDFNDDDSNS
jgi:hypothetical protein